MRRTRALEQVAVALMADPWGRHWGYELMKAARVRSGVMYPLLARLVDEGLLKDGWEDPNTITDRRPPRRYYVLTDAGRAELAAVAHAAQAREGSCANGWGFAQ